MIVVGASFGGMQALQRLLTPLDDSLRWPMAVVLHRHRDSDASLIVSMQRKVPVRIVEALDKQSIEPGTVYVAPADYHLLIDGELLALSIDEPVRYARPSVDVLFESAAVLGARAVAVVLSGGGSDGAQGAAVIEANGGRVFVQSPAEAICAEMPKAAIAATRGALVMDAEAIARKLLELDR